MSSKLHQIFVHGMIFAMRIPSVKKGGATSSLVTSFVNVSTAFDQISDDVNEPTSCTFMQRLRKRDEIMMSLNCTR